MLTAVLGYPHTQARDIQPTDLTNSPDPAGAIRIRGRPPPSTDDPRSCPACAVARWLEILGIADGLGRGLACMHLAVAQAPDAPRADPARARSHEQSARTNTPRVAPSLVEVLALLDQVAADADTANHRIEALLTEYDGGVDPVVPATVRGTGDSTRPRRRLPIPRRRSSVRC